MFSLLLPSHNLHHVVSMFSFQGTSELYSLKEVLRRLPERFVQRIYVKRSSLLVQSWWAKVDSVLFGLYSASPRVIVRYQLLCFLAVPFVPFCFRKIGGPKWTRTTDLTIISRVL